MSRWFRVAVPLGIAAVLVSVLAIGFGSPSSHAAPGGNGNGKANGHDNGHAGGKVSATITIVEHNPYNFGDQITFKVEGDVADIILVRNECYQGGDRVYSEYQQLWEGFAGPFTLGPTPVWSGGDADCHAYPLTYARDTFKPVKGSDIFYHVEA